MKMDVIRALLLFGGKGSSGGETNENLYYGVQFSGSSPAGVRTGAARDFAFTPGTDSYAGQNSFDAVYPWSWMRRCCCTLHEDGTLTVNAYAGQSGYAEDGSNGEVLVEVPLFYVAGALDVDPRISAVPLPGFRAPKKFRNADGTLKPRCYVRAFPGSIGADGKLHSVAGAAPTGSRTAAQFMNAARAWGQGYSVTTSADFELLAYLMTVVFATRDLQSLIAGVTNLYTTDLPVTADTADEAAVLTKAGNLAVGQVISIGTGGTNESVAARRIVTALTPQEDGTVKVHFSGEPVTTTTAHRITRMLQSTGTAAGVLASCGSPASNRDGKHSFVFYGVENPLYGNQWRLEGDWKLIGGVVHYCDDPAKCQWGSAADYTALPELAVPAGGYQRSLQALAEYPWLQIPAETGGSMGSWLSDNFYCNKSGGRIILRGGASCDGNAAGPFTISASYNAAWSGWNGGADLSVPG